MKKSFKQAVHEIKEAEQNVDEVLKAAKLARHPRQEMSGEAFACITMLGTMFMFFAFLTVMAIFG